MKPEPFPKATKVLTPPAGWDEETQGRCGLLPVQLKDGACVSCWSLTDEERQAVAAGSNIYVSVLSGATQPPIMLTVGDSL